MELTLRLFATFREIVGTKTITREFEGPQTVAAVLSALEVEYPDFEGELLIDGDLKPQINVLKNGREVLHIDGVDTPLEDGDTLSLFPPVAGG